MTREEVKNIVSHVFHFYEENAENCNWTDMNEACGEIIKALEQEPRWIPVSEKLPDAGEDVLVTVNLGSARVVEVDMYSLVEKDGFEGYGKDVIAWMPLPQPYREVEDGNN